MNDFCPTHTHPWLNLVRLLVHPLLLSLQIGKNNLHSLIVVHKGAHTHTKNPTMNHLSNFNIWLSSECSHLSLQCVLFCFLNYTISLTKEIKRWESEKSYFLTHLSWMRNSSTVLRDLIYIFLLQSQHVKYENWSEIYFKKLAFAMSG